jgi:hypothetical protein
MMKTYARFGAALACLAVLAAGCSGGNGSRGADAQASSPAAAVAQDAQSAASSLPSGADGQPAATAATPGTSATATAAATTAASGTCPLIASDQVETAMHLSVQSVEITNGSNGCTFHFKGGDHGDIQLTYAPQGGHDQLDSVRKAAAGASAIFGGIAKAASAPPGVMGVISATPPPDVAKVGDDQTFVTEGPVTQFYALKGDAYVEVDGGFLPEGVSRWVVLPEIARQVLAAR